MKLNQSWKTNTAGIATIVVGVGNLVIDVIQHGTVTTGAAGIAVTAVIAGVGLLNAKDNNVSNSPTPLSVAQPVAQTLAVVASVAQVVPELASAAAVATTVEQAVAKSAVSAVSEMPPSESRRF
jgi:hypothetical protein